MDINPDKLNRTIRDLRISVTDRCNFRCAYCMPKDVFTEKYQFLSRDRLLTFEEIDRLSAIFISMGVKKIRITGGEPLLRKDLDILISYLSKYQNIEIALTTNGSLLTRYAQRLKDAGLTRITVSLDSLDDTIFNQMNAVVFPVQGVLDGIQAAIDAGFHPLKINMVVKRGSNESSILPLAQYFRNTGHVLRFIEYMDVGNTNGWRMDDVMPAVEILDIVNQEFPIEPVMPGYDGEVAKRWRYKDGAGEIGVITSVTQAFCKSCSRIRLSANGKIYTCLFATDGTDFLPLLRENASESAIIEKITSIWTNRSDRYSEIRTQNTTELPKVEMFFIGG